MIDPSHSSIARTQQYTIRDLTLLGILFLAAWAALPVRAAESPVAAPPPAATPAPEAPTGRLAVSFLSPSERVEEPLVVTLTPALPAEMPGPRAAEIERRLVLARRPESSQAVFEGLAPGRWVLAWSGPGVSSDERGVTLSAGPTLSVDVPLRGGRSLAGSVRDDLGMVVAGAEVVVRTAAGPFDGTPRPVITAKSGGDGGFKLAGLPVDEDLAWEAKAEGHEVSKGRLGGETSLQVVLERAQRVTGRVVDADGKPIEGARVSVSWALKDADGVAREHRSQPGPILTDATGVFAFHRLYRWDGNLLVRARGHISARRELEALPTLGESRELDLGTLTLEEGRTIPGRVVAAEGGAPIAKAQLTAEWALSPRLLDWAHATSDEEGAFELSGLPEGSPVRLAAKAPGYALTWIDLSPEATSAELALRRGGKIEGLVCGTPAELARTSVWFGSEARRHSSGENLEVGPDGRFVVENAEPGRWTFTRAWSHRDAAGRTLGGAGGVANAEASATVEDGATARVRLACDGILVTGAVVANGTVPGERVLVLSRANRDFGDGLVDGASGRFAIRVPVPGRYEVWGARPPSGHAFASPACNVPPEGLAGCVLDLSSVPAM
ncbi:MAG: carboxypeptidase regulatory-like domain-containing protein [Holophagales bacterium]|nr:carboxypeptidase regulatory-like domain-containing protein [Holophagales bacterium]